MTHKLERPGRAGFICCAVAALLALAPGAAAQAPAAGQARPKVALVLEGGGALGIAHVGVIKVIEELGVPVDIVVGTSMGAIVGGFYAMGADAARLERIALDSDWTDLFNERARRGDERFPDRLDRGAYFAEIGIDAKGIKGSAGLLSGRKILAYLDRLTLEAGSPRDFDTLPRRFRAVATDVADGKPVVLSEGSLAEALRASMSIPGFFEPMKLGGRYLVDGGIVDNLPIELARSLGADLVVAVDLDNDKPFNAEAAERNPMDVLMRSLNTLINANSNRQLPDADLVLPVDLSGYEMTDFQKSREILDKGEAAARAKTAELEAFLARAGGPRALPARAAPETVRRVSVAGGRPEDRAKARLLLEPLVGTAPDQAALAGVLAKLEAQGLYESERLRLVAGAPEPTLELRLERKREQGDALRLGLRIATTYSGNATSDTNSSVTPSLVVRGLTTPDSRLSLGVSILDSPSSQIAFRQGFWDSFFLDLYVSSIVQSDTYSGDSGIGYVYQSRDLRTGYALGANPFRWMELSVGLCNDWLLSEKTPDIPAGTAQDSTLLFRTDFQVRTLDSPIFPTGGLYLDSRLDQSVPAGGGKRNFRVFRNEGCLVPAFDVPFSVSLAWKGGTDFSVLGDDSLAAPAYYKPDLADRRLFPGPLEARERLGSHVLGVGLEMKYQLNWASRALGYPAFVLLQAAAGEALQNAEDYRSLKDYVHWNASAGLGFRAGDAFGAELRVGVHHSIDASYKPFVALDLGAFGY